MKIAAKTLSAIEEALERDQGATFRTNLKDAIITVDDAYRGVSAPGRSHLGASMIGRPCSRELWYGFRWAGSSMPWSGRMLRLFNRGHLEEARFVALLQMIGCQVWQQDENGNQFRIGDGGHFGGSIDGVALGIPDCPDEPVIVEFKTHNDKSFKKLREEGVLKAKWEHFVQMQLYMGGNSLGKALYCAVNKNDDDLHMELIDFDNAVYFRYMERARMVVNAGSPPEKVHESPGWYQCKFCDFSDICHWEETPEKNCRTCSYSRPIARGLWECTNKESSGLLPVDKQRAACPHYAVNVSFFKKAP